MSTINLDIAQQEHIKTRKNDSFNLNIYFFENDGVTPWTEISAYTHIMQVRDFKNNLILIFSGDSITIDAQNGAVNLFKKADEMNIKEGAYIYDYQLEQVSSYERKTFLAGNFSITKDITI